MSALDPIDRRLVVETQAGLPLVAEPYAELGRRLGISADAVMTRLERLAASGAIRRIGVIPNHYALGYRANAMTVWDVDDRAVSELGKLVGGMACVTHCYRRPRRPPLWPYNLFAMVHARDRAEVDGMTVAIGRVLGGHARAHDVLYSTRILKKTGLRLAA
ncbi:MAG: Lrp/AsnC family transcriptional regulator [Alphaproteobacteria bacterium]|nr:Lrp/AsnC family transcriptional regulator [Alphaproteobacteria bacterium]